MKVCALFFRHGESKRGPTDRRASRALRELCPCPERRIQPRVHLSALRPIAQRSPICQIPPAARRFLPWLREKRGTNRSLVNLSFSYVLRKPTKKGQSVFLNALPSGDPDSIAEVARAAADSVCSPASSWRRPASRLQSRRRPTRRACISAR
jgi:hypothetical protein